MALSPPPTIAMDLVAEVGERAVAHGAGRHPSAALGQTLLVWEPDPAGVRARGNDHRVALDPDATARLQE